MKNVWLRKGPGETKGTKVLFILVCLFFLLDIPWGDRVFFFSRIGHTLNCCCMLLRMSKDRNGFLCSKPQRSLVLRTFLLNKVMEKYSFDTNGLESCVIATFLWQCCVWYSLSFTWSPTLCLCFLMFLKQFQVCLIPKILIQMTLKDVSGAPI